MKRNEESKRFIKTHIEGDIISVTEIWVDKQTGVNYLFHINGYAGGLTPLLDASGKPIVSNLKELEVKKEK